MPCRFRNQYFKNQVSMIIVLYPKIKYNQNKASLGQINILVMNIEWQRFLNCTRNHHAKLQINKIFLTRLNHR